jgi:peptide/nickel transport system substrate-binding protein
MKRVLVASAAFLAIVLAVSGCSAGKSVDLQSGGAPSGGTLTVAIGGEPDQLDPQKTSSYFSFEVLENVFDTLVQPDAKLQMQPALATKWETSDDQLTWTFHLRKGVTFQDGTPMTSADVVYSYKRIIDEKLSNAWKFSSVKDVTAPNASTVVITLTQPTPNLLSNLGGFKGMAIVEKANVESGKITTAPVGTGPFSVAENVQGDHITLKANPHYWGGAPKISKVEYKFISEPSTALAALKSGEIQWTDVVPTQQVAQLKKDSSITIGQTPSSDYWYLALNEQHAPWNNVKARQAIAYAIDRDAIIKAVSYGTAQKNELAIPKSSFWYTSYDKYSKNLSKAKELMSEAGYTGGSLDMLATSDYPETVTAAQIIAADLEPLGIKVNIRQPDFSTWLDEQNKGDFDMLMMGWLGNIDPDDFYYSQQHTDGSSNAQHYSNVTVDKLLDQARVEVDKDKRKQLYGEAAKIVADDASYIYLYNPAVIQAWSPKLKGYETRADRAIRFSTASLSG